MPILRIILSLTRLRIDNTLPRPVYLLVVFVTRPLLVSSILEQNLQTLVTRPYSNDHVHSTRIDFLS